MFSKFAFLVFPPLCPSPQVVIGDLGCVLTAAPHLRLQKILRLGDDCNSHVCTAEYRPPDVWLGSRRYQEDLDMWSFGCVAAEVYSRQTLIPSAPTTRQIFRSLALIVPSSNHWPEGSCRASWLEGLPFYRKWYICSGEEWLRAQAETASPWPPRCLQGCPEDLSRLIQNCLVWHPSARITATEAKTNGFLQPPGALPLHVLFAAQQGKNGVGTIALDYLDPDLLRYLQRCPSWNSLAQERLQTKATVSKCVQAKEAELRLKTEIPGFVDEANPPKCRSLNADTKLKLVPSKRVAAFVRALRKKWRPWLQQLGGKMREAVRADGMPQEIYEKNGQPILQEDFADNAFAYASIQLMQPGARNDGWHTDGGCSLLHASVTIFGTRSVEVKVEGQPEFTLEQEPGSFYVGNLAALEHNVRHHEECKQTFDGAAAASAATPEGATAEGDQRLQIAVMIRCDVFRDFRARKINSTPGPAELFRVVNYAAAQHLADVPVALPDLTEVLAEVDRTDLVSDDLVSDSPSDSTATVREF